MRLSEWLTLTITLAIGLVAMTIDDYRGWHRGPEDHIVAKQLPIKIELATTGGTISCSLPPPSKPASDDLGGCKYYGSQNNLSIYICP